MFNVLWSGPKSSLTWQVQTLLQESSHLDLIHHIYIYIYVYIRLKWPTNKLKTQKVPSSLLRKTTSPVENKVTKELYKGWRNLDDFIHQRSALVSHLRWSVCTFTSMAISLCSVLTLTMCTFPVCCCSLAVRHCVKLWQLQEKWKLKDLTKEVFI